MPSTFTENTQTEPAGFVKAFTGGPGDVPPGWVICDGNNGTPDLRDRFPRGKTPGATKSGKTGGANARTLTVGQLPAHSHSASVDTTGSHNHKIKIDDGAETINEYIGDANDNTPDKTHISESAGSHSHTFESPTTGGGGDVENQPVHQTVHFIMKL